MSTVDKKADQEAFMGDPLAWECRNLMDDWGTEHTIYTCPKCDALIMDPWKHQQWHWSALGGY